MLAIACRCRQDRTIGITRRTACWCNNRVANRRGTAAGEVIPRALQGRAHVVVTGAVFYLVQRIEYISLVAGDFAVVQLIDTQYVTLAIEL